MTGRDCYCPVRDGSAEIPRLLSPDDQPAGRPMARLRLPGLGSAALRGDRLGCSTAGWAPRSWWSIGILVGAALGIYLTGHGSETGHASDAPDSARAARRSSTRDTGDTREPDGRPPPSEASRLRGPATSTCRRIGPDKTFEFLGQTMYLGVTKPMLQLVLAARPGLRVLLRRLAQAARWCPGRLQFVGEEAYGFVRNSHRPRHHRQPRLHAVRALPVRALLLHPAQQPLRDDPVPPVPDVLALGHGLRARGC